MIKLFRNLRKNMLSEGKTSKYLKYAIGEIVLVVIGILIALQINNWNEDRKERRIEVKYLTNLKEDLQNDLIGLNRMKQIRIDKGKAFTELLQAAKKIDGVDLYRIDSLRILVTLWEEFVPNDNTFEELRSSGNLRLLKNDTIKSLLLDLSNKNKLLVAGSNHMRREYDYYIYDQQAKTVNFLDVNDPDKVTTTMGWFFPDKKIMAQRADQVRQSYEALLSNVIFINGLALSAGNNAYMIDDYNTMLHEIQNLIKLIDADLNTAD